MSFFKRLSDWMDSHWPNVPYYSPVSASSIQYELECFRIRMELQSQINAQWKEEG